MLNLYIVLNSVSYSCIVDKDTLNNCDFHVSKRVKHSNLLLKNGESLVNGLWTVMPHSHRKSHFSLYFHMYVKSRLDGSVLFHVLPCTVLHFFFFLYFPTLCFCLKFLVHFLVWDTIQNLGWTVPRPCTPKSRVTNAKDKILVDKDFQTSSPRQVTWHLFIQIKLEGEGKCLHSLLFCTRLCLIMA